MESHQRGLATIARTCDGILENLSIKDIYSHTRVSSFHQIQVLWEIFTSQGTFFYPFSFAFIKKS